MQKRRSCFGERRRVMKSLSLADERDFVFVVREVQSAADPYEHRRKVVFGPALVADALHLFAGRFERRRVPYDRRKFGVGYVTRDAVGAEKKDRAVLNLDGLRVHLG